MGLSLGGMTAMGLALAHPGRFERIICCDTRADAPADAEAQALAPAITLAWRRAYGRSPDPDEAAETIGFLADELTILRGAAAEIAAPAERRARALANLCQQLLASNEFLHVD